MLESIEGKDVSEQLSDSATINKQHKQHTRYEYKKEGKRDGLLEE